MSQGSGKKQTYKTNRSVQPTLQGGSIKTSKLVPMELGWK
jgi:hypothetical protein